MTQQSSVKLLKEFFSVEGKPITNTELIEFRKSDKEGFEEMVRLVLENAKK